MACREWCEEELHQTSCTLSHANPAWFVTSQWPKVRWPVYVGYRWAVAVYLTIWVLLSGVWQYPWYREESDRVKWFIYLTNWSFLTLTVSTLFEAAVTTHVFVNYADENGNPLVEDMKWYLQMSWLLNNMAAGIGPCITVIFYVFMAHKVPYGVHPVDVHTHAVNCGYIVFNLMLSAAPIRVFHFLHPMFFSMLYLLFTVIYYIYGGTNALGQSYIYSILDWDEFNIAFWYLVMYFVLLAVVWLLLHGLYLLRMFLYNKYFKETVAENRIPEAWQLINIGDKDQPKYASTVELY